jgi:hypothetical protein
VFWAICSLVVAIEAWKGHLAPAQRSAQGSHFVSRAPLVHEPGDGSTEISERRGDQPRLTLPASRPRSTLMRYPIEAG